MSILIFAVVFALTLLLQQWLHRHIQSLTLALTGNPGCAIRALFYVLLPGVVLHEASHYLAARLLLVRVNGINVGIGRAKNSTVSLGSVNIQRADPIRESLIGVAPFVIGIVAIWLVMGEGFDLWPSGGLAFMPMLQVVQQYAHDWTTWLDLYLIFAVSTVMIPSESDREPWGPVITIFVLLAAILFLLGWTPNIPPNIVAQARNLIDALSFALGVAVVVNGVVAIALWLLERTVEQISGKPLAFRVKKR